jgi:hypothetical protein
MAVYKFLQSIHTDRLLIDGTVRISALSFYRELEGEQWIADRLEGSVEVNIDHLVVTGNEAGELAPLGYPLVARADAGGMIVVENCIFSYQHPDAFIFCASQGDLPSLTESMCRDRTTRYEACVRIVDLELLAHRMFYRGAVVEMDGAKVSHLFTEFRSAPVVYKGLSRPQQMGRPPSPSPFLKHDVFAGQREVRIAFQPRQPIPLRTLTIKIPRPESIFVEEFRNRPPIPADC